MIKLKKFYCRKCGYTLGAIEEKQLLDPNVTITYKCKCGENHNLKEHDCENLEEESMEKYTEKENKKESKDLYKKNI